MSYKKINGIVQVQGGTETHWTNSSANIPNGMLVHALDTGNIKLGNGETPYVDCLTLLNSNNLKGAQKVFTNIPEPISGEDDGKVVIIQNGKFALATFSANNAVSLTDFEASLLEKSDINHTHDDDYYTSLEVNEKVNEIKGLSKADQDIISYLTLKDAEKNVRSGVTLSDSFMDEYNNLKYIDTTESNIDVSIPGEIHPNDGKTILTSTPLLEKSGDVPKVNIFLRGSKAKYINLNDVLEVSKDGINWYTTELTEVSFLPEDDVTAYVGNVEFDKKLIVDNKQLRDDLGYEDLKGNITNISILNVGKANFDQPVMRDIIGSVVYLNNGVELCTILDIKNDGTNIDDVSITSAPIGNYTVSSIRKFYTNDKIESHNFSATLTDVLFRRRLLSCVENNGLIYFAGGQEEDNTQHDSFYSYNPVTKEINELSSKLIRDGATLFSYKSKIIAMSYNTFTIYDTITDTWEDKVAPKYKYLLAGGIIGDDLYIYGGYTTGISGVTNDFWKCSLVDYTWTQLDDGPFPEGNIRAGSCVYENELYILGGTGGSSGYYTEFYKYSPVTENWTLIDNLPEGHEQNWLFNISGIFYIFNITNDNIYKYDPSVKKWINIGENKTRMSFSMCQFGNSIYSLSGNNENRHSPEVWRYSFNDTNNEKDIEYVGTEKLTILPTTCPTNSNTDRYGHIGEILYGNLVVCGGQNNQLEFHEYDIENEQYLGTLANMPYERSYASSVVVNQILYLFFGMYTASNTVYSNVWSYNRRTDTWTDITPATSPAARYTHTTVAIDNKVYLYGGCNNNTTFNDTWEFDLDAKVWTRLADGFGPCTWHTAGAIGTKMYIIGGRDRPSAEGSTTYDTIRIFDTVTNTWSKVPGIVGLINASAVALNNRLYIVGGHYQYLECRSEDIYEYNPETDNILIVKKLNVGKAAASVSVKDNKIIIFGGRDLTDEDTHLNPIVYDKSIVANEEISYGRLTKLTEKSLPKDCTISKVGDSLVCCGGRYNDSRKIGYLHKYHIPTKAWTKGTDIGPIIKHSSISNGTELFIFGGIDKEGNALNLFRKYNPITDTWTELAIGPSARYGTCMAINDDVIYLHAGYTNSGPAKDTWKYTISTNTWTQLSDAKTSRYNHSMTIIDNNLVIHGGKKESALSDTWRYDIVNDEWIILKDSCLARYDGYIFNINDHMIVLGGKTETGYINENLIYSPPNNNWNPLNKLDLDTTKMTHEEGNVYILDTLNHIHRLTLENIPFAEENFKINDTINMLAYKGSETSETYYGHNTVYAASACFAKQKEGCITIYLYKDYTTNKLSLHIVFDKHDSSSRVHDISFRVTNLPTDSIVSVSDDDGEAVKVSDTEVLFSGGYMAVATDGLVIDNINTFESINMVLETSTVKSGSDLVEWQFCSSNDDVVYLDVVKGQPITLTKDTDRKLFYVHYENGSTAITCNNYLNKLPLDNDNRPKVEGGSSIIVGEEMFVFGGYSYPKGSTDIAFKVDLKTFKTTYLAKMLNNTYVSKALLHDNKIYLFGGLIHNLEESLSVSTNKLQVYDLATDTWEIHNTPLSARHNYTREIIDDKLYVISGRNYSAGETTHLTLPNDLWEYDLINKTWTNIDTCPYGGTYMNSTAVYNNEIYIGGGYYDGSVTSRLFLKYNPITKVWTRLADIPEDLMWSRLSNIGDYIYCTGGGNINKSIFKYSIIDNTWSTAHINTGYFSDKLHSAATCSDGNNLWFYGGRYFDQEPLIKHSSIFKYNETDGLVPVDLRPASIKRSGKVLYDNKIYYIGGDLDNPVTNYSSGKIEGIWILDLLSKKWSFIEMPGLKIYAQEWIEFEGKFYGWYGDYTDSQYMSIDPVTLETTYYPSQRSWNYALTKTSSTMYYSSGYIDGVMSKEFWKWDKINQKWDRLSDQPKVTSWHKLIAYNDTKIFLLASWSGSGPMTDFWEYDIASDTWSILPDKPIASHAFGAYLVGNYIYMVGGVYNLDNRTYRYSILEQSWARVDDTVELGRDLIIYPYNGSVVVLPNIFYNDDIITRINYPTLIEVEKAMEDNESISHTNKKKYFDIRNHTSCNIDNHIYMYENGNLYKYNTNTEHLVTLSASPISLKNAKSLIHDNRIYIYGGIDTNNNPSMVISIYDIASDTWSTATGPAENYGHSVSKFNNLLISIGGNNGAINHTNIYTYNLDTGNTNDYPVTDTDTLYGTSHIYNNELYYIGGKNQSGVANKMVIFKDLPIFQNKEVLETPFRLHKHGSCIIDNYLVVYGGIDENEKPSNKIYIFNLVTRTWNKYKTITEPRYGHCLLNIDNEPFVIGGVKYMNSSEPCFFKFDFMKKETSSIVLNNTDGWNIMNVKGNYLDDTYLFISTDIDTYSTYVNNTNTYKEVVKKIGGIWNYLTKDNIWMPADDIHQASERAFNYLDEHEKDPVQQVTENMSDDILILEGTRNTITDINNRSVITTNKQVVENTTLKYRINSEDGMTVHGIRLLAE